MRSSPVVLLLLLLAPAGCNTEAAGALAAAGAASAPVFHRSIPDLAVCAVTERDCPVVRLDQGTTYCRAIEPPPDRPPLRTRGLGVVDCWSGPRH